MSTNKRRPTRADSIDCDYDYDSVISMQNTGVGVGEILQYSSALLTPDEIRALVRGYERLLYDLETDSLFAAYELAPSDFLAKPLRMERLRVAVRNALDHRNLLIRKEQLQREADKSNTCLGRKVHQLERVCRILEDESQVIKQDFERAAVIQSALLPAELPRLSGVHMHVAYRPGNCVGGDLYHATRINKRYAAICIADAAGHGVSAAMMSVLFKHHLRH